MPKPVTAVHEYNHANYPKMGELWDCEGRLAFIAGTSHDEKNNRIWVMDWNTGEEGYALVVKLTLRDDRHAVSSDEIVNKFTQWALEGNTGAMWFLAWWYEGVNHQKSVWYYIAALRRNPSAYGWAYSRIVSDARNPIMCEGITIPSIDFLNNIPEFNKAQILSDKWHEAAVEAHAA